MNDYKTCTKCGQSKPRTAEFFHRNKKSPDGLRPDCADCGRSRSKDYAQANSEANRQRVNKWRKENPSRKKETNAKWYERNKKRIRAEWKSQYYKNPEAYKAASRRRRAREKNVKSERYTWHDVIERWGIDCHICGEEIDLEAPRQNNKFGWERGLQLDHVIPISKGGSDLLSNVKPAHGLCNLKKGDSLPTY